MSNVLCEVGVDLIGVARRTEAAYTRRDWRARPIFERGESLVQVPSDSCHPFYAREMKLSTDTRIFVRASIMAMLGEANRVIGRTGCRIVVYDGWRSVALQESLFWYYLKCFTVPKFGLEQWFAACTAPDEVRDAFDRLPTDLTVRMKDVHRSYVSWPSSDPKKPSPHATGGSIDVWLYRDGYPVDLGVPFDWMGEEAGAFYHFKPGRSEFTRSESDGVVVRNRELLLEAMVIAGFSCYPPEIWHFNYGNQMDSLVTGEVACYSYVEP